MKYLAVMGFLCSVIVFTSLSCEKEQQSNQKQLVQRIAEIEAEEISSLAFINGNQIYPINEFDSHIVTTGDTIEIFSESPYYIGGIQYFNEVTIKLKIDGVIVEQQTCECEAQIQYIVQ